MITTNSNFVPRRIFVLLLVLISLSTQVLAKENPELGSQNRNSNKSAQHNNIPKDTAVTQLSGTISMRSYLRADPRILQSRYGFTSTAIPLGKGNGYGQLALLGLSRVSYGVTKNITIGIAAQLFPLFEAEAPDLPHMHIAYGAKLNRRLFLNLEINAGSIDPDVWPIFESWIFYGRSVLTYTKSRWIISTGFGYGAERTRKYDYYYSTKPEVNYEKLVAPTFQMGARFLVHRHLSFFLESFIIPQENETYSEYPPNDNWSNRFYILQYAQLGFNSDYDRGNFGLGVIFITDKLSGYGPIPTFDMSLKF